MITFTKLKSSTSRARASHTFSNYRFIRDLLTKTLDRVNSRVTSFTFNTRYLYHSISVLFSRRAIRLNGCTERVHIGVHSTRIQAGVERYSLQGVRKRRNKSPRPVVLGAL